VFLKNFIFIDNEEINRTFDRHILQLTGGTVNMGVIDIVKRQEGNRVRYRVPSEKAMRSFII